MRRYILSRVEKRRGHLLRVYISAPKSNTMLQLHFTLKKDITPKIETCSEKRINKFN
jgi:hypothetical protein